MSKRTCWYLHTINGKPAYFSGDQLVFAMQRQNVNILVPDLKTVIAQRRMTLDYRRRMGIQDDPADKYGYIVFGTRKSRRALASSRV